MRTIQRVFLRTSAVLLVVAAIASTGYAQGGGGIGNTTSTPVAGVPHDYITGVNEIVNPANGALSVRIAQPVPHERGENWPSYAFIYDSNSQYSLQPTWLTTADPPFTALTALLSSAQPPSPQAPGVTVPSVNGLSVCLQNGQYGCITWSCNVYSGYRFTDLNGGLHGLGLQLAVPVTHNSSNDCGYFSENNYYYGGDEQYKASMDTSGHVTVVDLHGNLPDVEDANGNYRNSTGRTSPLPAPFTVQTQHINVSTSLNVLNNSQDGGACQETTIGLGGSVLVPKSITLPNTEKYSFQYDPAFGLISKITYPTGATVTYTWSVIPDAEGVQYHTITSTLGGTCSLQHDWFAITKRVVTFDGVTNAEEQDFAYSTTWPNAQSYHWTNKQTTVTTKDLIRGTSFKTVYNYLPVLPPAEGPNAFEDLAYVPVENTIQYYDTTGSPLRTTTKVWATMNTMSAECETLPNGSTSGKFYSYQAYAGFAGLSPQPINGGAGVTDLPTDVAEYDYGQVNSSCSKPGSSVLPVRETVTSYKAFANSPFSPLNSIQDRPASVQVYGVVGAVRTLLQETDYAYDGAAPSCVYSPSCATPTGHDETNYGVGSAAPRGNPTTVTKKCFVGSTNCANSVTTFIYDTTGQVLSSTDADLNTTSYSYVDNYTTDDGSPSGNTNAYLTKITRPTTNGFAHVSTYQYGFEDGKFRSESDENSQITKFCYWTGGCSGSSFDPFVRLTGVSYPDTGSTTIAYNDAGPSPSETTTIAITSGLNMVSTTTYDAIGHTVQTALSSDPSTAYTVTTYDGVGQPYRVYNPTRCSTPTTNCGEPTWGYTTHNHDALNRTTSLVEQDGSIVTTTYDQTNSASSGTCTTVKDETGKSRQSCSDALGRMTGVWEDPAGLNYETDYT